MKRGHTAIAWFTLAGLLAVGCVVENNAPPQDPTQVNTVPPAGTTTTTTATATAVATATATPTATPTPTPSATATAASSGPPAPPTSDMLSCQMDTDCVGVAANGCCQN